MTGKGTIILKESAFDLDTIHSVAIYNKKL